MYSGGRQWSCRNARASARLVESLQFVKDLEIRIGVLYGGWPKAETPSAWTGRPSRTGVASDSQSDAVSRPFVFPTKRPYQFANLSRKCSGTEYTSMHRNSQRLAVCRKALEDV